MNNYSQSRAMWSITVASLKSLFKSRSTLFFSLVFPFIFILVFGFIGGGTSKFDVAFREGSDTTNNIYQTLIKDSSFRITKKISNDEMEKMLNQKDLDAIITFRKNEEGKPLTIDIKYNITSSEFIKNMKARIETMLKADPYAIYSNGIPAAYFHDEISNARVYQRIDFVLPGQLGFSILSTGVFATAFLFFGLRDTLVLKRFFATPVKRSTIILGEAISRVLFQLMGTLLIILIGHFAFNFTLIHGAVTVINMLLFATMGLMVFMGFGFVVSGIARNQAAIPPIANLITLPQFLLAGTFFPISAFPSWLQPICKILPLTYLNDALRKIAFDGYTFFQCWEQLLVLGVWGVVVYAVATKVFRWE